MSSSSQRLSAQARFIFAEQSGKIDWGALSQLDVEALRGAGDVAALQPVLANLLYSEFTARDAAGASDGDLARLVNALQSSCEYMVFVQLSLGESLAAAQKKLDEAGEKLGDVAKRRDLMERRLAKVEELPESAPQLPQLDAPDGG